jgi:hypothetical protein
LVTGTFGSVESAPDVGVGTLAELVVEVVDVAAGAVVMAPWVEPADGAVATPGAVEPLPPQAATATPTAIAARVSDVFFGISRREASGND